MKVFHNKLESFESFYSAGLADGTDALVFFFPRRYLIVFIVGRLVVGVGRLRAGLSESVDVDDSR